MPRITKSLRTNNYNNNTHTDTKNTRDENTDSDQRNRIQYAQLTASRDKQNKQTHKQLAIKQASRQDKQLASSQAQCKVQGNPQKTQRERVGR